jgi:hypothetical protein
LTWTVTDGKGRPESAVQPQFGSSNRSVATVTAAGLVTGVAPGSTIISASVGSARDQVTITVTGGGIATPAGGTIALADGAVELVVPSGAVPSPTAIQIATTPSPFLDPTGVGGSTYSIGPAGLTLALPATIRVRFNPGGGPIGLPAADLRLRGLAGDAWTVMTNGTIDPATSTASAQLSRDAVVSVGWVVPVAPCISDETHQFDFWLGAWSVRGTGGQAFAQSDITAPPGGCAIFEHYRDNGGTVGRSISFYQADTGRWYQTYVDSNGFRLLLAGTFRNGAMELLNPPGGGPVHQRWRWTVEGSEVRQVAAETSNGGVSYGAPSFTGIYSRR